MEKDISLQEIPGEKIGDIKDISKCLRIITVQ